LVSAPDRGGPPVLLVHAAIGAESYPRLGRAGCSRSSAVSAAMCVALLPAAAVPLAVGEASVFTIPSGCIMQPTGADVGPGPTRSCRVVSTV
jgi:hypothetical protein